MNFVDSKIDDGFLGKFRVKYTRERKRDRILSKI